MSFTSDVKERLSQINNLAKKDQVKSELNGYLVSNNIAIKNEKINFSTESEYNINRFGKLLKNVNINDYEISIKGKIYTITFKIKENIEDIENVNNEFFLKVTDYKEEQEKALARGCFLGGGYINNPEKKYHLEINLNNERNAKTLMQILNKYEITAKIMKKDNAALLYIKDGEEISKFLAFIGADSSVLKFEEVRVVRDTRNNFNRLINCETANLEKTISAGNKQIEDIKYLKSKNKYSELPDNLKDVAEIRLKHPDASLAEIAELMGNVITKSGVSHRLAAISKLADELRK